MAYPWIKFYTKTLEDPRVGALRDRAWRRYHELQLLAGECNAGGRLRLNGRPLTLAELAWRLRIPARRLQADLEALLACGLLTRQAEPCGECYALPAFPDAQNRPESQVRERWRLQKQRQRLAAHAPANAPADRHVAMSADVPADMDADIRADFDADNADVRGRNLLKEEDIEEELEKEGEQEEEEIDTAGADKRAPTRRRVVQPHGIAASAAARPADAGQADAEQFLRPALHRQAAKTSLPSGRAPLDAAERGAAGGDALEIYRTMAGIGPPPDRRDEIVAAVHDPPRWRATLEHWLEHGWNPHNLTGQLDLYQRGGPAACRSCRPIDILVQQFAASGP